MTFEQRLLKERREGSMQRYRRKSVSGRREQQVQRPRGRNGCGYSRNLRETNVAGAELTRKEVVGDEVFSKARK